MSHQLFVFLSQESFQVDTEIFQPGWENFQCKPVEIQK